LSAKKKIYTLRLGFAYFLNSSAEFNQCNQDTMVRCYLKSFFYNFLTVFFANYLFPGINIADPSKLPHIGSDLIFSGVVGAANVLIIPMLRLSGQPVTVGRLAAVTCGVNWVAYIVCKFASFGIDILDAEGFFLASTSVIICGFLTGFFEMKMVSSLARPPEHTDSV
jgi:uncharacterized membrane protein YvlD (DUF360 family)